MADQILINAAGCLNAIVVERAGDTLTLGILADIMPHVNRAIPEIRTLAEACDGLVRAAAHPRGPDWCRA